jgi:PEP-CTERM motif
MWCKKAAVALLAAAAFIGQAQAANVATEFSVGSNPGGAWSYGWAPNLGTGFDLALFNWTFGSGPNVAGGWSVQDPAIVPDANPSVLWLNNGSGTLFSYSTISAPSRSVNLHPGASGELAVVRWTAPTAGEYLISGAFRGNDVSGTTTDVHVLHNNVALVNGAVSGFADTEGFSQTLFLAAGDRLDFAVGTGGNGFFNDSTGLSAIISAVPEPSSYAMLFAGLGVIAVMARRRREAGAA